MPKSKSEPVDLSKKQRYARSQSSLLSTTNNQVKKRENNKPRSKSKSPRNSAIIPGVRISKLKLNLTPTSSSNSIKSSSASPADPNKKVDMTLDLKNENLSHPCTTNSDTRTGYSDNTTNVVKKAGWQGMAVSEIWADESPNVEDKLIGITNQNNTGNSNSSIIPPLPVSCTTSGSGSGVMVVGSNNIAGATKPQNQSIDRLTDESSMASSICSTLDSIQPPSLMNSLISMSESRIPSLPNSPKVTSKLECRHNVMNLSGKKGQKVPEMVRRALGQVEQFDEKIASTDLSSSISRYVYYFYFICKKLREIIHGPIFFFSCQSNLDNIKPPTDMDSSILSIASISSEIAEVNNHATSADNSTTLSDKTLVNRLLLEEDDEKTGLFTII